ncbi:MAG: aminoacyl-tRNA hydrolase [Ruminococcaceae bacterium]|nr:aminoacyl-tRNA hydrolase [Oscillospiraceae bacterium]
MADIFDLFRKIEKKEAVPATPIKWLIVGLGNPGDKYKLTRHNAGFLTIDSLAEACGARIDRLRFHALCGEAMIGDQRVLLMKPQTLMNASGTAVIEAAAFYKIAPEHILVISDDIAQAPGKMRLRARGSAGGQKGLNDIITRMGTDAIPRLRMGVGAKPHPDFDLADWVLSNFSAEELTLLRGTFSTARAGIEKLLNGDFDAAMQICNSYKPQV